MEKIGKKIECGEDTLLAKVVRSLVLPTRYFSSTNRKNKVQNTLRYKSQNKKSRKHFEMKSSLS